MFVMDTTGSMGDELSFLQTELSDIINGLPLQQSNINVGLVFYRDYGDVYVTRAYEFSNDLNTVQLNLNQERAQGGGDYPEAMDQALSAAIGAQWRSNSRRILFLLADAPPHGDRMRATWRAAEQARLSNIHLIPVAASGVAEDAEYIMRSIAALTNSRYLFLTDDSGYGLPHATPDVDCYVVTSLRNSMIRAMNSLVTGNRIEPADNDIIRRVGNYNNGVCDQPDPQDPSDPVNYNVLIDRQIPLNGTFTQARKQVINNQSALDQVLAGYGESSVNVDFTNQKVVLLDMGQRNTGGWQISIRSVTENADTVQVNAEFTGPGEDCLATQALTNPYLLATIDTQKEISFSIDTALYCD
ncbi:MAG: protease complex subunit PrcB family protein [Pseudomonadota bacterium]